MHEYIKRMQIVFFFFNDTATTEIYTLSLHDALPICVRPRAAGGPREHLVARGTGGVVPVQAHLERARRGHQVGGLRWHGDRKSTRLNSSHANISYAVFCLKKKKNNSSVNLSYVYNLS